MGPAFVEALAVSRFHGVGPATAAKMERLGIRTGRDLREQSLAFLQEHFGKAGAHFHAIARGEDDRPVRPDRPRKSAGSETTYPQDLGDPARGRGGHRGAGGRGLGLVREDGRLRPDGDGEAPLRRLPHADPQPDRRGAGRQPAALAGTAVELVRGVFPLEKKVRLLGVTVSGFGAAGGTRATPDGFDFGQPGWARDACPSRTDVPPVAPLFRKSRV